jgi:hypothetical protein
LKYSKSIIVKTSAQAHRAWAVLARRLGFQTSRGDPNVSALIRYAVELAEAEGVERAKGWREGENV